MEGIAIVRLDLAKVPLQVHGVAATEPFSSENSSVAARWWHSSPVFRPAWPGLRPAPEPAVSGRELPRHGHEVRLMPSAYVKAYVKRCKTDAADAEAIAEALTRPTIRFVAVDTKSQQAVLMLHKTRDLLVAIHIQGLNEPAKRDCCELFEGKVPV